MFILPIYEDTFKNSWKIKLQDICFVIKRFKINSWIFFTVYISHVLSEDPLFVYISNNCENKLFKELLLNFKDSLIYLKNWEVVTSKWPIPGTDSLSKCLQQLGLGKTNTLIPGSPSTASKWTAATQVLEPASKVP